MTVMGDPLTCHTRLMAVQSWFARAGNIPRFLKVEWQSTAKQELFDEMGLLTRLLSAYPYKVICLSLYSKELLHRIVTELPNDALLHLEVLHPNEIDSDEDSGDTLARLPNLAYLTISNPQWDSQFLKTAVVSWCYLDMFPPLPASFFFEILRKGSSLEYCRLIVEAESTVVTETPLTSNVRSLHLIFGNEIAAEPFIHLRVVRCTASKISTLGCTTYQLACMTR